jgi:hypothetical protein
MRRTWKDALRITVPAMVLAALSATGAAGQQHDRDRGIERMTLIDSLGQEPMSGPDAWEAFGMGRGGLVVPYGRDVSWERARALRFAMLEQRLGLSATQRTRLEALRASAASDAKQRARAIALAAAGLEERLADDPPDRAAIRRATERVARLESAALEARVQLALDERAVLTAAQRRLLDDYGRK